MKRAAILLALVLAAPVATAQSLRLDDSASPRARFDLQSDWRHEGDELMGSDELNAQVARAPGVEIRLNTAALVGKRGRIYLALPHAVPGLGSPQGLRLEWSGRGGLFQSGAVLPGSRTLLYDGPIASPVTRDVLDLSFLFDARHAVASLRVEPYFEFDPAP